MLKSKQTLDMIVKFLTSKYVMVLIMNTLYIEITIEEEAVTNGK